MVEDEEAGRNKKTKRNERSRKLEILFKGNSYDYGTLSIFTYLFL